MKDYSGLVKKFKDKNVLVIGDSMLDRYIIGKSSRLSPEAPVPVVEQQEITYRLGGAANVAVNVADLGANAALVSVIGEDIEGKEFSVLAEQKNVNTSYVYKLFERPTTLKTRILAGNQQIVRLDRETREEIDPYLRSELIRMLYDLIPAYDAVVISDYGKGLLNMEIVPFIIERCLVSGRPVIVDPIPFNFEYYKNATLITPNRKESEKMSGIKITDELSLEKTGNLLLEKLKCEYLLITLGEQGMALFEADKKRVDLPTSQKDVYDVTGAGDLVCSVMALGLSAKIGFYKSAFISNIAAGIEITKLGNVSVTSQELISRLEEK